MPRLLLLQVCCSVVGLVASCGLDFGPALHVKAHVGVAVSHQEGSCSKSTPGPKAVVQSSPYPPALSLNVMHMNAPNLDASSIRVSETGFKKN